MLRHRPSIASASGTLSTCSVYAYRCRRCLHSPTPEPPVVHDEPRVKRFVHRTYPHLDHKRYIDPTSLEQSLKNVREANRATLIRKIFQDGRSEPLRLTERVPTTPSLEQMGSRSLEEAFSPSRSIWPKAERKQRPANPHTLKREWRTDDKTAPDLTQPWLSHIIPLSKECTAEESLTSEIEAFDRYMTPLRPEQVAAQQAVEDTQLVAASMDTDLKLELIGSRANGLAMPLSDLDFNVITKDGRFDDIVDRMRAKKYLNRLKTKLSRTRQFSNLVLVARARIPIIRGFHRRTGLEIQIQQTTNAYNSTEHVRMALKEHPTLRALYTVIRKLLIMRGLSDGSKRGLSSYPLVNMILVSLKLNEQHSRPADAGNQLLSFLKMYSEIDFETTALTVSPPSLVPTLPAESKNSEVDCQSGDSLEWALPKPRNPSGMRLKDPADPSNDLGRCCSKIKDVQTTFLAAKQLLEKSMSQWRPEAGEEQQRPFLQFLVGDYTAFELDRAVLARCGSARPQPLSLPVRDYTSHRQLDI